MKESKVWYSVYVTICVVLKRQGHYVCALESLWRGAQSPALPTSYKERPGGVRWETDLLFTRCSIVLLNFLTYTFIN